jgi:hypothetical protein
MSGDFLNSVNHYLKSQKEGRITAVITKARYQIATKNQIQLRLEHSARSRSSKSVIKVLLDSGSDGDLMFRGKGTPMHFPYLTWQVPTSWRTSNGMFLSKERSKVKINIFEYSNDKKYLVTPDVVEYDKNKMTKPVYDLILECKPMKKLGIVLDF